MNDIASALLRATKMLNAASDTPRLDAELLMAHALRLERGNMLLRMRDLEAPAEFDDLIARRASHEPVAYIIGHQDFWDLTLNVTPDTLIPRADSETLIEAARRHFEGAVPPCHILDMGTGSGALLLAALSLYPSANGIGIESSKAALVVAQSNADRLDFAGRCQLRHASWNNDDWAKDLASFDLILCNPPYIKSDLALMPSVQNFEPHAALFSGADGLDDYRCIIPQIPKLLSHNGIAIFEIGIGQTDAVSQIAGASGLTVTAHDDLAAIPRALVMSSRSS